MVQYRATGDTVLEVFYYIFLTESIWDKEKFILSYGHLTVNLLIINPFLPHKFLFYRPWKLNMAPNFQIASVVELALIYFPHSLFYGHFSGSKYFYGISNPFKYRDESVSRHSVS